METIRFVNLPHLLNDMKRKNWIIDTFIFDYKSVEYAVILKVYSENEIKPNKFAKVKLEFVKLIGCCESIHAYADFYEVHFNTVTEFANFFGIKRGDANRDLFKDFSEIFAESIPSQKNEVKDTELMRLQGSRCEGNNPNAVYCYDVRRNGSSADGNPNKRSVANSNKAKSLRPTLYDRYKDDLNLSFFFSDEQSKEKTDEDIIRLVAGR